MVKARRSTSKKAKEVRTALHRNSGSVVGAMGSHQCRRQGG